MEDHSADIAYFESITSGKPISDAQRDVTMSAEVIRCESRKKSVLPSFCCFVSVFLLSLLHILFEHLDLESNHGLSLEDYAGWADKIKGDVYPADDGFYKIITQEPLGVCAGITAWNGSLHFLAWKAGPALACGNTCIIKPSEKSPFGTLAVGYLVEAAGFPPGVLQILPGQWPPPVGNGIY